MVEVVVLFVIKKIGIAMACETPKLAKPLLGKNSELQMALPVNMKRIKDEFEIISAFLKETGMKVIKTWIRQVRRLAYDMEDIVDEFMYFIGEHQQRERWASMRKIFKKHRSIFSLDEIAKKADIINKEVVELSKRIGRWAQPMSGENCIPFINYDSEQQLYHPGDDHTINDNELIGIDKNREILINSLHLEDSSLRIIAVWGMGRLGKSTLVNNVYKNEAVVSNFNCHAWVSVSQSCKIIDIWRNMLKEISGNDNRASDTTSMNSAELRAELMKREILRDFLGDMALSELHLNGRLYTWSNQREHPTLERIDRVFVSSDWLELLPNHWLRSLSSDCSDHSPMLLQTCCVPWAKRHFRFESVWTKFPGFLDVVRDAWACPVVGLDRCRTLDAKLRSTAAALKGWSNRHIGSVRLQLAMARELIFQFDSAEEVRDLLPHEIAFRGQLKLRCLGLASMARTIARQRSRLLFLEAGDVNTKFFHLQACHRSRKSFIPELRVDGSQVLDPDRMAEALLDFGRIGVPSVDLRGLDHCFTEEEIWGIIREMPSEKAPGPDGFTGLFFKTAWSIIKEDVVNAVNAFWSLDYRSLNLVNDAYLVLLKKKDQPKEIKDYRPISLIHSFGKLLTKLLANRLAPRLDGLVMKNQCAFIKGRSIHDCFRAVQLSCRLLHRKKVSCVLLKVDIARAFDSVAWPFLLELLEHLGFPRRWRDWISLLLQASSTKILLNGNPGRRICHARGLRQGDSLSPMLFVLVMDVLNALIKLAEETGLLSPLGQQAIRSRASLYADDLVIFVRPARQDLLALRSILDVFAGCSGLCPNLVKCSATPIQCSDEELVRVQSILGCQLTQFPCTYLGVPLSTRKLSRSLEQELVDKVARRIPRWKGKLLSVAGRLVLIKSTLSAIPVHISIATCLSGWAIRAIDRLRRAFLWSGSDILGCGHSKVAWRTLCRPVEYGGLGITDLSLLGLALRVRWSWFLRTDPDRMWADMDVSNERAVRDLFRVGTEVILSNGLSALFWLDNWLDGAAIEVIAPNLFAAVPPRLHRRTVAEGLSDKTWIRDIKKQLSVVAISEYVDIWERTQGLELVDRPDSFVGVGRRIFSTLLPLRTDPAFLVQL
ncbi:hypothetical protein U9M48_014716 [Paspalum notatum var. saurae]|uniref:Reverse transcriptase domain-containing protein n=1 Tax=Paspalum notatum var. saurae TaxID=547442 RepID=A0AAQ3WL57_PASNO